MSNHSLHYCFDPELETAPDRPALERVRYFPRQLLTAEDMRLEQDYFRQKLRRHNWFLHGWGVVCGLGVAPDSADDAPPWQVVIEPGYALGPYGDEIYVADPVHLDLAQCIEGTSTDPCEPGTLVGAGASQGSPVYIAIRYAECNTAPVRAMPEGCACSEEACEYSRIRESFEIQCLGALPASHSRDSSFGICEGATPPCPPCPDDPWVVLAEIKLPTAGHTPIAKENIQMAIRRQIYSTAILQDNLIQCCCEAGHVRENLRVVEVGLYSPDGTPHLLDSDPNNQPLNVSNQVAEIKIRFSSDIDRTSVTSVHDNSTWNQFQCSSSVVVVRLGQVIDVLVGEIKFNDDDATLISFCPCQNLSAGSYRMFLFGNERSLVFTVAGNCKAIKGANGSRLDGDYLGLPSGDGVPGGDFVFEFQVQS